MLVNFVSESRVRESRAHGLIRGGCRKAVAYFLGKLHSFANVHQNRLFRAIRNWPILTGLLCISFAILPQ